MILAVDFDGVLTENNYPELGEPYLEVIEALKRRRTAGDKIILWTCREGRHLQEAVKWSRKLGLEYDAVNENVDEIKKMGFGKHKIYADAYIDDRNKNVDWLIEKRKMHFTYQLTKWLKAEELGKVVAQLEKYREPFKIKEKGKRVAIFTRGLCIKDPKNDFKSFAKHGIG